MVGERDGEGGEKSWSKSVLGGGLRDKRRGAVDAQATRRASRRKQKGGKQVLGMDIYTGTEASLLDRHGGNKERRASG